ncbi:hypothetical protein Hanom_Chr12g01076861 [Helianthus anomalus]
MFNHHSKFYETLDSISHQPCPLRLFKPSSTSIAPLSATKPGNGEHHDVSSMSLSPLIFNFCSAKSQLPVLFTLICFLLIIRML